MCTEQEKHPSDAQFKERLLANLPPEEHHEFTVALDLLSTKLSLRALFYSLQLLSEGGYSKHYGMTALSFCLQVATILTEDFRLSETSVEALFLYFPFVQQQNAIDSPPLKASPEALSLLQQLLTAQKIFSEKGKEASDEEVRELLVSSAGDVRVLLIMIAYRLFLLRNGKKLLSSDQAYKLGEETSRFFIPLTHKLGLYAVKGELEDLSLKFTQPTAFYEIKTKLGEKKVERNNYMRRVVRLIEDRFDKAKVRWSYTIKSRTKSIFSVYNKMVKKGVAFDDIYDLAALRIIIDADKKEEEEACWYFYSLVTDLFEPNPQRLRDWISVPKQNGYQSLQITVKGPDDKYVEVQIRTEEMDEVAEHGVAAHWRYKGLGRETTIDSALAHARTLLEEKEASSEEDTRFKMAKAKHTYAFTPMGKPIKLPPNATLLDFAFAIHTNVGYHTKGGKINGKNASIRSVLKSGDTVEVITDRNQSPNKDWLKIAVSSSARNKIQRFLREEREGSFAEIREQIERRLKNRKISLDEKILVQSFIQLGYHDYNSFYTAVVEGKCDVSRLLEAYEAKLAPQEKVECPSKETSPKKKKTRAEESPNAADRSVAVEGVKGSIYYELAKCCTPQYGDAIFAYPSRFGIRIHRYDCPNAKDIFQNFRSRVLPAHWKSLEDQTRTNLYIEAVDDTETTGRVVSLCKLNEGTTLLSYNIKSSLGKIEAEFTFEGALPAINTLRNKLLSTKGVLSVSRA